MLWKLLLSLAALFDRDSSSTGPRNARELALAREALHGGNHYGGDMIFPADFDTSSAGIKDTKYRWPGYPGGAEVPYVIDASLSKHTQLIESAMEQYHKKTCVKFVKRTNQQDYIKIYNGNGCSSVIGKNGGQQALSLADPACIYVGTIVHELGHAIGLYHEHQRSDRNTYITVNKNNVNQNRWSQFDLTDASKEIIDTPYNYNSIMHYGNYAFSLRWGVLKSMEAKNGTPLKEPYEKAGLDNTDVQMIKKLYKC